MSACETNLDTSDIYHSALDTLMNSLQINSTTNSSSSSSCNNSFQRHFIPHANTNFFSFCSTIKRSQNTSANKAGENADANKTPQQNIRDTPKRAVTTTRKLKLFENTEEGTPKTNGTSSERELSPRSVLLKKAITRLECIQRGEKKTAQNKKPMRRTSLRV